MITVISLSELSDHPVIIVISPLVTEWHFPKGFFDSASRIYDMGGSCPAVRTKVYERLNSVVPNLVLDLPLVNFHC